MHFVLTLHSHLPYVLNHGRWPHGSDWLCEAALDTYLPFLESLMELEEEGVRAPLTLGITPVLANQLSDPLFADEMEAFFQQRMEACDEAPDSLEKTGDRHLLPLVDFWRNRFEHLHTLFRAVDGNLVEAFRRREEEGRLEIISSAATHGFLPLLGREESVQLQLDVGAREHRRLLGREPKGCWVPECAYSPRSRWDPLPGISRPQERGGVEEYLAEAGFGYFFIDTHMAEAGESLGSYGDVPHGVERFDAHWRGPDHPHTGERHRSPYEAYLVDSGDTGSSVAAFVREPRSSMQVWSRHRGYPGEAQYLEFHKIRWPGGLKFWRVTGPKLDLGDKEPYTPPLALERSREHARHFAELLGQIREEEGVGPEGVALAPFDTELFGHWWFEGVRFLQALFVHLPGVETVVPVSASKHLEASPPRHRIRPLTGSWGANGDFSMWMNDSTQWTWERLWPLEEAFWNAAPRALEEPGREEILAQAARQLLLAQSSDWQFMISTGAVPDYAERRFTQHCEDAEELVAALGGDVPEAQVARAREKARELDSRDRLFPEVLASVRQVLDRSGS